MRSIFVMMFLVFLYLENVRSYRLKTKIPVIMETEAAQWLSTRDAPRRWRQPYLISQPSDDISQPLQLINDNGIRQFDSQSFDGIPMEVLYELSRQGRSLNRF